MEENDSLPIEGREGKPRFGKVLRTKSYRWIFYTALILLGLMITTEMIVYIMEVLDKFPDSGDPGYENYIKFMYSFPAIMTAINSFALLLFGFGCFFVGIVDYTLPPNVRRGFIFGVPVFMVAYEFFAFFRFMALW